ncbi:ATP-dependent zinc metalloprotease FtsH [Flexilinea flocculi]|uniref:ATP-dependent zinc metalloprotease FtsH n=1 Tax=Flexilinea flocculi TaxID=1678840 RepID=A0A0K8PB96_9CHLR|nr:ATP-dependent zinc metalloprotease FtsH [Flexilinea flocculi]GAP39916.1 ATP-dependent metalloprotease FtsH [Flexilinea flocculi]
MKQRGQTNFVYLLLLVGIISLLLYSFTGDRASSDNISINQLADQIKEGTVAKIESDGTSVLVLFKDRRTAKSVIEGNATILEQLSLLGVTPENLSSNNIELTIKEESSWLGIFSILSYLLPVIFLVGAMYFIFRQTQGTNNSALSFGKSRAKMFEGDHPTVTFADVAGVDESKEELREVVEFLKEPQKFTSLGARIPKGVLLVGSPGTGKTLLAKAVSGEAGVPFFSISGSEFVEMFVGVGASRVRDLFEQAKKNSPCIIFIDEIDAVGRQRGAGLGGSHDEREQTLNQMLVEMDGFETDTNIIIIAATNRPDILDPALLRPGRFDRQVVLDRPDVGGREAILKVHSKGKPLDPDVDLTTLARATSGFVGADLENLMNEAAILAARKNKNSISKADLEEAVEKVVAGPQKKSRILSDKEKMIIAYHEAGHAMIMNVIPECDPVHKVTIIGRGSAGGYTMHLPTEDRVLLSKNQIIAEMISLLGGRAAEELMFDDITSGASNDIERVTGLARSMVTRLGMSEAMGTIVYGKKEEMIFLGREISEQRDYSESIAEKIDAEVRRIVDESYAKAKSILNEYRDKLDLIAQKLIEVETLSREEFEALFPPPNGKRSSTPNYLSEPVKN